MSVLMVHRFRKQPPSSGTRYFEWQSSNIREEGDAVRLGMHTDRVSEGAGHATAWAGLGCSSGSSSSGRTQ